MVDTNYDSDLYAWTLAQATHLRHRKWDALDVDHLAEEIEALGNEQRHAVESHLRILLIHLLKWAYQPRRRRRSWLSSMTNARAEIEARLRRNPSLRRELPEFLAWAYPKACRAAADETGRPRASFPQSCPWSIEQILDDDFLPEPVEE
jgi:hypothetical protein